MANTKKLNLKERRAAKRKSRRALKDIFGKLNRKQRREFRESDKGIKAFWTEQQKEAEGE